MLRPNESVIDAATPDAVLFPDGAGRGLVPRDYAAHPVGYLGALGPPMHAVDMPLIPEAEWPERIRDMVATKSRLSDIRLAGNGGQPIPSLDQNPWGYCWSHSSTHANMLLRAAANQPYVPLSAFAVAATIKGGRDQGGWGAQSLEFITERGQPSQAFWPQKDVNLGRGTAACWANAALHKVTEGWVDLQAAQYDRNLTFAQVVTCLLSRVPVVGDFNWWGHSVCLMDAVDGVAAFNAGDLRAGSGRLLTAREFEAGWEVDVTGGVAVRIWNSWGDGWQDRGMGVLTGSKAIPDGATAPRATTGGDA